MTRGTLGIETRTNILGIHFLLMNSVEFFLEYYIMNSSTKADVKVKILGRGNIDYPENSSGDDRGHIQNQWDCSSDAYNAYNVAVDCMRNEGADETRGQARDSTASCINQCTGQTDCE